MVTEVRGSGPSISGNFRFSKYGSLLTFEVIRFGRESGLVWGGGSGGLAPGQVIEKLASDTLVRLG